MTNRNVLWFGATQPIARIAGVRLAAIGSGYYRPSDVVGAHDAAEGTVSLRALARIGTVRTWSALSYGRSTAEGNQSPAGNISEIPTNLMLNSNLADTMLSLRSDFGTLSRAEAGVLTSSGSVEFAFGVSLERATRFTRHTLHVTDPPVPETALASHRSEQRVDRAIGLASASFRTGPTNWFVSLSTPIKDWVSRETTGPLPQRTPAVASVAFMQPLTAWLSVVGAASTNASTVGSYALRDDSRADFAPVVALGVRISRFSLRNEPGEPTGILAFETRTIGIIDSVTAETVGVDSLVIAETGRELVRVLLVIDAPRAEVVEMMGDATSWSVTSMFRARDGKWRAELRVPPGMHRIAVRADGGAWIAPPGLPMSVDDFGSRVGLLVVKLRNY